MIFDRQNDHHEPNNIAGKHQDAPKVRNTIPTPESNFKNPADFSEFSKHTSIEQLDSRQSSSRWSH